jgi:hypothetical protein
MSDSAAASPETSRRRLLAWLGAGGVAALATLFSQDEAKAGHDGTNTLHLGEFNHAPPGASTGVEATAEIFALRIHNESTGPDAGGVLASSRGEQAAIQGNAFDAPTGVRGISLTATEELGEHQGVLGLSGSGVGVEGSAPTGTGVFGRSETGTGGWFETVSGTALQVVGPAGVGANVDGFIVGVENENTNETAGGIFVVGHGGKPAIEADALPGDFGPGVALQGVSGTHETFGQGPGTGVQGISGTGIGVEAISENGLALRVQGRAAFSAVGSASVPTGQSSVLVANPTVTADSHIAITLTSDPGRRSVLWVERAPGSGFIVHLTAPAQGALGLTYSILEPL